MFLAGSLTILPLAILSRGAVCQPSLPAPAHTIDATKYQPLPTEAKCSRKTRWTGLEQVTRD